MKKNKLHFWYTKSQRNGVLFLIILIFLAQLVYVFVDFSTTDEVNLNTSEIIAFEKEIDSLRNVEIEKRKPKLFPFNPNFITDFKGYQLGMSTEEIDRLHQFRLTDKYVNSAQEFQKVTGVSDSLLLIISPYFKFPDWVTNKKVVASSKQTSFNKEVNISTNDINLATQEDFKTINGVGDKLSERIIKYRSKLQGFSFDDQLNEVWGLEDVVVKRILKVFSIQSIPTIKKLNVNTAKFKEVLAIPYIDYDLCKKIFEYRDEVAELQDIAELRNIKDFPQKKYDRIVLYLNAE
ncbi:DNA uptake protein ComE-like DNA-binding protein [Tenacibaculum skagerrakense]|uniref:DNA uptake protein ComE-like DNA-binding protein n=1 Tax=Tenacibaculum skagerrakense TaxID=186571 RepID=A0A4R2NS03_9FLAO|nr:helix-hairpin-helix domain-containing protein [Tenacibaculum skagerrakense]TCP24224.1 DNA uptake protein ComE-like DNA-binding protein [Tenacibaculum skagerrakense]